MSRNSDIEAAWTYHRITNHSEASLREDSHALDFSNHPVPFKVYTDIEPIRLEQDLAVYGATAPTAIRASAAAAAPESERVPDLAALAHLLYFSAGVLRRKRYPGGEIYFRAYPNTGALYHVDLYVVCGDLPGLPAGVYHFGAHDFALRRLRTGDFRGTLVEATGGAPAISHAPATLASASTYWRNAWKYRTRAYRHCFWDAGTMHANLLAVGAAAGFTPRGHVGFADRPVEELLGLDAFNEGALTLVPLGWTAAPAPAAPPLSALSCNTLPLSAHPIDFPPIREMHAASSLETGAEAAAWRGSPTRPVSPPARGRLFSLQPPAAAQEPTAPLEEVIVRRGSTRQFDPARAISFGELSLVLDAAGCGIPADFLEEPGASLIELYLIVHNVDDLPPGAYRYRREERALELLREGDYRSIAGRLGLFQHLPADAAVNLYALADLRAVLDRFGNRGYRAAQLEGGIQGGRIYLSAYAQRIGATGLTFLDDEVIEFFSPAAAGMSVMFLTALGRAPRR